MCSRIISSIKVHLPFTLLYTRTAQRHNVLLFFYISLLLTKNFKLEDEGSSFPLYTRLSLLGLLKGNGVRFRVLEEVVFMALESSDFIFNYLIDETLTCDTVTVSKRELTEKTYDKKQNKIYKRRFEKNLKQHSVEIVTAVTMTAVHENLL